MIKLWAHLNTKPDSHTAVQASFPWLIAYKKIPLYLKERKSIQLKQNWHKKHSSLNREPIKMHCHISTNLGQVFDEAGPHSQFWSSHASRLFVYEAKTTKMGCKKRIGPVRRRIRHTLCHTAKRNHKPVLCNSYDSHSLWLFSSQFIPLGATVKAIKARQVCYPACQSSVTS